MGKGPGPDSALSGPDDVAISTNRSAMISIRSTQKCTTQDDEAFIDWVAERYDRCHPNDSFFDLAGRAFFSKEDRRLMEDWLEAGRLSYRRP